MKVRQISSHVWGLKTWMVIPIQVWIVTTEEGVVLVDAGIPMMAKGILRTIEQLNRGPLVAILLTHGHSDHVGAVQHILSTTSVPVYVHSTEIPYTTGELPYPRRKKAAKAVKKDILIPLPSTESGLASIHGLLPYHTPGHAPGHVAYYHPEDRVLMGGDLYTSKRGELRRPMPMFTGDMRQAIESGAIVQTLKPEVLTICHSGDVRNPHEQYDHYRNRWLNG